MITIMKKETVVLHGMSKMHFNAKKAHTNAMKRAQLSSSSDVPGTIEEEFHHVTKVSEKN